MFLFVVTTNHTQYDSRFKRKRTTEKKEIEKKRFDGDISNLC
jgi:hypothetical protein